MKPLNRAERNNAFWRFLLFFLVTIALVVLVIFFSIAVPYRESKQLREKVVALQKESKLSASFNTAMKEAMDEINKFSIKAESPKTINQRVQYKIEEMEKLLHQIPGNDENSVYSLIVRNISDLNNAKFKLSIANIE